MVQFSKTLSTSKDNSNIAAGSHEHVASSGGQAVNAVMRAAMKKESTDNLSVVLLTFQNLQNYFNSQDFK